MASWVVFLPLFLFSGIYFCISFCGTRRRELKLFDVYLFEWNSTFCGRSEAFQLIRCIFSRAFLVGLINDHWKAGGHGWSWRENCRVKMWRSVSCFSPYSCWLPPMHLSLKFETKLLPSPEMFRDITESLKGRHCWKAILETKKRLSIHEPHCDVDAGISSFVFE